MSVSATLRLRVGISTIITSRVVACSTVLATVLRKTELDRDETTAGRTSRPAWLMKSTETKLTAYGRSAVDNDVILTSVVVVVAAIVGIF